MLRNVRTDGWYNVSVTLRRMRVSTELAALRSPCVPKRALSAQKYLDYP
jgi:hypothetical protein